MKRKNIILMIFAFVIVGSLCYTLLNPNWGLIASKENTAYFEKIKQAEVAFKDDDFEKSASLFSGTLVYAEENKVAQKEKAYLHFWLGNSYYKKAEKIFWQYVNVVSDPDIHQIPDLTEAEKLYEKAEKEFGKVAQLKSDLTWQANYNKGNALERRLIIMIVSEENAEKIKNFYELTLKSFFEAKDTYPRPGYDLDTIQNIEFLVRSPEKGKKGGLGGILKEREIKKEQKKVVLPGTQASPGTRTSGIK